MGGVGRPSQRARMGREALEEGQEGSGGPPIGPGGLGRDGRGREALLEGWEWSGGPPKGQGRDGIFSRVPGGVGSPFWRDWRGLEVLREGRERLVGPPRGPSGIEMDGRGWESPQEGREYWEAFLEGREGSGGPPRVPGGVGRGGRGWETHPEGQEESGRPPVGLGRVGRLSQRDGRGRVALLEA